MPTHTTDGGRPPGVAGGNEPTPTTDGGQVADVAAGGTPVQASWPDLGCYGCGPANPDGLHLESYVDADGRALVATVEPHASFVSVPGTVYGGYLAAIVDCNSMWAAMTFAGPSGERGSDARPPHARPPAAYVTAELDVTFRRPTPTDVPLWLRSWVDRDGAGAGTDGDRRVTVRSEVGVEGDVTVEAEALAARVDGVL